MRYKKYSSYKKSGVEWLGQIPNDWISIRFKHTFSEKKKRQNLELNCGAISFGNVVYKDDEKIPIETKVSYQEVKVGEFLINPLNLNFDLKSLRTALSSIDVVVSTGYIVLQSNGNKNYLRWLLYQFDIAHMKTLGAGVRQTVNYTDIGNEYFYLPSSQEQQQIANFLDNATSKIDTLIEKQTKLIELLKEKRQAVISHAVTKGLDPNVAMKDSGVEWLGKIPEDWELWKMSYAFKTIGSGTTPSSSNEEYYNGYIPWVTTGELRENVITTTKKMVSKKAMAENSSLKIFKKNSIVIAMYGATIGRLGKLGIDATTN